MTQGVCKIGYINQQYWGYQQVWIFILQHLGYLPTENAAGNIYA